jgi:hypothetical protein
MLNIAAKFKAGSYADDVLRSGSTKRITREDARRFATAVARLPELLDELRWLRATGDEPA